MIKDVTDIGIESGIGMLSSNSGQVCFIPICNDTFEKGMKVVFSP